MSLTREGIAYRVARDLPEGSYVNLGFGIPVLVAAYLPKDREIFLHSENGILGAGPQARPGSEDPDLMNAEKQYVGLVTGSSVFDHVLSFTMIRGGHLTHAVIGGIEVAANGDLANWRVPGQKVVPGVGGAMDLAFGVKNVYVAMNHVTNKGEPKIVARCRCPLTAPRCVKRIYTDMALIEVTPEGLVLREFAPGLDPSAVQARTGAPLRVAQDCTEMDIPGAFNGTALVGQKIEEPGI
jgi:3-oxoacid CoA-transferase B subunit